MDTLIIRPYVPADWPAVCTIHDRARPGELAGSCDPRAFVPLAEDKAYAESFANATKFVALLDGQPAGFVGVEDTFLSWLYVDPTFARRGVGRTLLQHAKRLIGPNGWTIVLAGNIAAQRLYAAEGFVEVGRFAGDNEGYPCTCLRLALTRP